MKNVVFASVAVAIFGLAGCASEDKMMKDDAMAKETMVKEEAMVKEEPATAEGSGDAMMDLCGSKGGSVIEIPGEEGATKYCDTGEGQYPLAQLTAFPEFQ